MHHAAPCTSLQELHQVAPCISLQSAHLAVQLHIPELWVHAKCYAMQIIVQVVLALPHAVIDSSFLARIEAGAIHIVLEQAAVEVYLQQSESICILAIGRHDWADVGFNWQESSNKLQLTLDSAGRLLSVKRSSFTTGAKISTS